jgi:hypothetical protein
VTDVLSVVQFAFTEMVCAMSVKVKYSAIYVESVAIVSAKIHINNSRQMEIANYARS